MTRSAFGDPLRRLEDGRLVTGAGSYVDDVRIPGAGHVAFVRSPFAHAVIRSVDLSRAASAEGCWAAVDGSSLRLPAMRETPIIAPVFARPPFAEGVVRFVGEPVAAVVAATRELAADLASRVEVDYDPLPVAVDPETALSEAAPILFPEAATNLAYEVRAGDEGDVLAGSEVIASGRVVNQRVAPVPLEPGAVAAAPQPDGSLLVWVSTQVPFDVRAAIASALGLDRSLVRVIAPDVGGGFGAKAYVYPEQVVVAALASRLGRPVRYVETRSENMVAMTHGRGQVQEFELGATRDGRLVGLRVKVIADAGAYPGLGAYLPVFTSLMISGVYRIPQVAFHAVSAATNTTPVTAYRGAGRPEATALIERAMDELAAKLGEDPAALRRKNLLARSEMPYRTRTGATYDSGDYAQALDLALESAGYEELRADQAERRQAGGRPLMGIGVSVYVEVTGGVPPIPEFGSVEVRPDGTVRVAAGTMGTGQGHRTAFSQLVSDVLKVPVEDVEVVEGDTAAVPRGIGTFASRSLQLGGTAIHRSCEAVREKAMHLAAHLREAAVADVRHTDDGFVVAGAPGSLVTWAALAAAAGDPAALPAGMEPGLSAEADFDQARSSTYPYGAHVAVVEVDPETGEARLVRLVAVDDCGRILNPVLVQGQVHGGLAQGVGQALFEGVSYGPDGAPLTASLVDYLVPTAGELPDFETHHTAVPTPLNPLGAKGVGESGAIGSTPAVQSAVVDALRHLGVTHLDMPLGPEVVWRALSEGRGRA